MSPESSTVRIRADFNSFAADLQKGSDATQKWLDKMTVQADRATKKLVQAMAGGNEDAIVKASAVQEKAVARLNAQKAVHMATLRKEMDELQQVRPARVAAIDAKLEQQSKDRFVRNEMAKIEAVNARTKAELEAARIEAALSMGSGYVPGGQRGSGQVAPGAMGGRGGKGNYRSMYMARQAVGFAVGSMMTGSAPESGMGRMAMIGMGSMMMAPGLEGGALAGVAVLGEAYQEAVKRQKELNDLSVDYRKTIESVAEKIRAVAEGPTTRLGSVAREAAAEWRQKADAEQEKVDQDRPGLFAVFGIGKRYDERDAENKQIEAARLQAALQDRRANAEQKRFDAYADAKRNDARAERSLSSHYGLLEAQAAGMGGGPAQERAELDIKQNKRYFDGKQSLDKAYRDETHALDERDAAAKLIKDKKARDEAQTQIASERTALDQSHQADLTEMTVGNFRLSLQETANLEKKIKLRSDESKILHQDLPAQETAIAASVRGYEREYQLTNAKALAEIKVAKLHNDDVNVADIKADREKKIADLQQRQADEEYSRHQQIDVMMMKARGMTEDQIALEMLRRKLQEDRVNDVEKEVDLLAKAQAEVRGYAMTQEFAAMQISINANMGIITESVAKVQEASLHNRNMTPDQAARLERMTREQSATAGFAADRMRLHPKEEYNKYERRNKIAADAIGTKEADDDAKRLDMDKLREMTRGLHSGAGEFIHSGESRWEKAQATSLKRDGLDHQMLQELKNLYNLWKGGLTLKSKG